MRTTTSQGFVRRETVPAMGLIICLFAATGGLSQQPGEDGPCGGIVDCGAAPVPLLGADGWTEFEPNGNFFGWNPANPTCWQFTEPIVGGDVLSVGNITEGLFWTSPFPVGSPGQPAMGVIVGGQVREFPLTGTTMHAGGCGCVASITSNDEVGNAVAVTDEVIAALGAGQVREFPLPVGSHPLSNLAVGFKLRWNWHFLGYFVETDAPTMEFVLGGVRWTWSLPAARVDMPDSYNGDLLGVGFIYYTQDAVYVGSIFSPTQLTTTPLPAPYAGKDYFPGGVLVHCTDGNDVPIIAPGLLVPFGPCDQPLRSCRDATNSRMAVNINPAFEGANQIDAETADWPMLLADCEPGEKGHPPIIVKNKCPKKKWGAAYAYAYTTGGGAVEDGWNWKVIWRNGNLCISDTTSAFAISAGDGLAIAKSWITGECPGCPPGNKFELRYGLFAFVDADFFNRDTYYSRARAVAAVTDPIVFGNWNPSEDLQVKLSLADGTFVEMPNDVNLLHNKSVSLLYMQTRTSIPTYADLFKCTITATPNEGLPLWGVDVDFVSNPALGLSDSMIEYQIKNAFHYDDVNGGFAVSANTTIADFNVNIPDGVTGFELTTRSSSVLEFFGRDYSGPELNSPGYFCGNAIIDSNEECDPPWCGCGNDCNNRDTLSGDTNADGTVTFEDFAEMGEFWRQGAWVAGDINKNGMVDLYDLKNMAWRWLEETSWYPCP